jgi:hypothetical protein
MRQTRIVATQAVDYAEAAARSREEFLAAERRGEPWVARARARVARLCRDTRTPRRLTAAETSLDNKKRRLQTLELAAGLEITR